MAPTSTVRPSSPNASQRGRALEPAWRSASQRADAANFLKQLTLYSDDVCNTSPTQSGTFEFGPYPSTMLNDPLTTQNGVLIVTGASMPAPDESQPYGWIYNPTTLQIIANLQGADAQGIPYSRY